MLKYLIVLPLALSACASASAPVPVPNIKPIGSKKEPTPVHNHVRAAKFAAWKKDFIARSIAKNYSADLVTPLINRAIINPLALERDQKQPEFSKPIWSYVDGAASKIRVDNGKTKLAKHQELFDTIESRYGVDRYVLTAIWGLESAYGKIMGTHDIIDSLATFAFEGRRQDFGEAQLFAVLDMLTSKTVRKDQLVGSWASAMGMTQFIPATFRDYAVDFYKDGNKDLWTSAGDALGSSAHYLSRHGWRLEEPVFTEVVLPAKFDYGLADGTKHTVSSWNRMGVRGVNGQKWSQKALFLEAKLLVPAGSKGPVFLTFKNFDVIKKYNNSTSYALGIGVLAKGFQGINPITRDWPRQDAALSLTAKKSLQRALTAQGYDTKGIDGKIGPATRRAIRAWQSAHGVPADAYVEKKLLARILRGT